MYRKIELNYKINNSNSIIIEYVEETQTGVKSIIKEYDILKIDEETMIYNNILDDLQAEFDGILSNLIQKLVDKIMAENGGEK